MLLSQIKDGENGDKLRSSLAHPFQYSLSTLLTSGNSVAFLTVTTLTRSLCNSSEECLFQDGMAERAPLKTRLKAESDVPSS